MDCLWEATVKAFKANDCCWYLEIKKGCKGYENHAGDGFNLRLKLNPKIKVFIVSFTDYVGILNREVSISLRD